jgi:hypothetical protein
MHFLYSMSGTYLRKIVISVSDKLLKLSGMFEAVVRLLGMEVKFLSFD